MGFATAYRLWRFPETARLRLSQVLVLPPYQRRNVGTQLMHAAYACARQHGAADLTVSCSSPPASRCVGPVVALYQCRPPPGERFRPHHEVQEAMREQLMATAACLAPLRCLHRGHDLAAAMLSQASLAC